MHGDTLSLLRSFRPGSFDALITDPPYASGGSKPAEKNRTTNQKYSSLKSDSLFPDFDGDQKDQRSWTRWMAEWLSDARRACKPGAPVCLFIDWRQYPSITDALQWAGWVWRGCVVWDKLTCRPQKGRFRQQSEYIIWGSNGPLPLDRPVGCLPGVFRYANPQNRTHVTEKPLQLMRDLVKICVPGGRILDPFCGAGTTMGSIRSYLLYRHRSHGQRDAAEYSWLRRPRGIPIHLPESEVELSPPDAGGGIYYVQRSTGILS